MLSVAFTRVALQQIFLFSPLRSEKAFISDQWVCAFQTTLYTVDASSEEAAEVAADAEGVVHLQDGQDLCYRHDLPDISEPSKLEEKRKKSNLLERHLAREVGQLVRPHQGHLVALARLAEAALDVARNVRGDELPLEVRAGDGVGHGGEVSEETRRGAHEPAFAHGVEETRGLWKDETRFLVRELFFLFRIMRSVWEGV